MRVAPALAMPTAEWARVCVPMDTPVLRLGMGPVGTRRCAQPIHAMRVQHLPTAALATAQAPSPAEAPASRFATPAIR